MKNWHQILPVCVVFLFALVSLFSLVYYSLHISFRDIIEVQISKYIVGIWFIVGNVFFSYVFWKVKEDE